MRRWLCVVLASFLGQACTRVADTAVPPTFSRDIAPILAAHCVGCHRPGGIAPFSLQTFADVRANGSRIVRALERGQMPPWLPDKGAEEFRDARALSVDQVATVRAWVEQGMKPDSAMAAPATAEPSWQLGPPDLVVRLPEPFTLAPGAVDAFRNFVLPVDVTQRSYVRGVEFRWGTAGAVHHAVLGVDPTGESKRLDDADAEPGFSGMLSEGFRSPDGHFVGWTPGRRPALDPTGMAWRLDPGTDLVLQVHMLPSARPITVAPEIGLYLSRQPPSQTPFMVKLTSTSIDIPPGATDYVVEDTYVLPVDVTVLSVYPHAHYLARRVLARATRPDGSTRDLLTIPAWNFHFQEFYRYQRPIELPRGTRLSMRISYDNTAAHQHDGGGAPRRVVYGPRSSDEMADLWLQVLPRSPEDLPVLAQDFVARRREARMRAAREAIEREPASASGYNLLGTEHMGAGQLAEAIDALRNAVRREPRHAEANNNLGVALLRAGRAAEAVQYLRTASSVRPGDARVWFNLGNAWRESGQAGRAAEAFDRCLALDPRNAEAHNNRGVLAGAAGDLVRARGHFVEALRLRERYPEAHHNLALALASLGDADAALTHVERALELQPDYPEAAATARELRGARARGAAK